MRRWHALGLVVLAGCSDKVAADCVAWHQWGNNAAHDGTTCAVGQPLDRAIATLEFDRFAANEEYDASGDLIIHYQTPLLDGDSVYMTAKTGTYTPCLQDKLGMPDCYEPSELHRLDSQVWSEVAYVWQGETLASRWTFASDWKPEPQVGFEPMFQPALAGTRIAIPGASGSIWELDAASGNVVAHIDPFAGDPNTYVAGGLTVRDGTIYYNALHLDADRPYAAPSQAWLVAIDEGGHVRAADYATLVPDAPAPSDPCYGQFDPQFVSLPWPPPPGPDGMPVLPARSACGTQLPGINLAPAIAADGTIFTATHAQYHERYSYIVAVAPDLTPKWATSLRGLVDDGCGVLVADDGDLAHPLDCRPGASHGVDPATNLPPAAEVSDSSSSSPVALPDGGVVYGAYTGYNNFRGHLIELDALGNYVGNYDFGWDTTPAVMADGSIVLKDNHYVFDSQGMDLGPYYITELDRSLVPRWRFESSWTESCARQPDGSLACTSDHPYGFEWCINAPAVDADGTIFANSEDGHLYAIGPEGQLRGQFFLDRALGAAYTPLAIDHRGRIYALNSGTLTVVGH